MDSTELIDAIAGGETSSSEISDYIKGLLHTKASEKVASLKPSVAADLFGAEDEEETVEEPEVTQEPEEEE
jgi:hypothetical protein